MSDSENIPQMRERITELEKQVKAQTSQVDTLSVENRTLKAKDIFRDLGYRPEVAETFVKAVDGEPTPDAVDAFAQQLGLTPQAKGESGAEGAQGTTSAEGGGTSESSETSALSSMARGGSSSGAGGQPTAEQQIMPRQEWIALSKTDPGKARQVLAEGRVGIRSDNPYAASST